MIRCVSSSHRMIRGISSSHHCIVFWIEKARGVQLSRGPACPPFSPPAAFNSPSLPTASSLRPPHSSDTSLVRRSSRRDITLPPCGLSARLSLSHVSLTARLRRPLQPQAPTTTPVPLLVGASPGALSRLARITSPLFGPALSRMRGAQPHPRGGGTAVRVTSSGVTGSPGPPTGRILLYRSAETRAPPGPHRTVTPTCRCSRLASGLS